MEHIKYGYTEGRGRWKLAFPGTCCAHIKESHFLYHPCKVRGIFLLFTDKEMEIKISIPLVMKLSVRAFPSHNNLYGLPRQGPDIVVILLQFLMECLTRSRCPAKFLEV